jgi:hypothetical protein
MRTSTLIVSLCALFVCATLCSVAEARHVRVSYVDAGRPPNFAKENVLAAIQRALREWEAHNSIGFFVFHWDGEIALADAPDDWDHVVIRWDGQCSMLRGQSCYNWSDCERSAPVVGAPSFLGCAATVPTNHILMSTARTNFSLPETTWNRPTWVWSDAPILDMTSNLMHELGHILRRQPNSYSQHVPTGQSVLQSPGVYQSRHLWNSDILGIHPDYPGHIQAIQFFSVSPNGSVSVKGHFFPAHRVLSPVAVSVGDGVPGRGEYLTAFGTRHPAGTSGPRNAFGLVSTNGSATQFETIATAQLDGVEVGYSYHHPCVAVSASGNDYYLVWTSPIEATDGWRRILSMESHGSLNAWGPPVIVPDAWTRTGVTCSIDRATERLVVAFSHAAEEGIFLSHRPSLTAGSGQWSYPQRIATTVLSRTSSSYDPPEISFDFFDTAGVLGTLAWQDNADLKTHSVFVFFSGGTYQQFGSLNTHNVDGSRLRSWPVIAAEGNPILGASMFLGGGSGYAYYRRDERHDILVPATIHVDNPFYVVGSVDANRRYTGAASNRLFFERAFVSTANMGL